MQTEVVNGALMVGVADFINMIHGEIVPGVASTKEYRRVQTLPGGVKVGRTRMFRADSIRPIMVDFAHLPGARAALEEIDEKMALFRREAAWLLESTVDPDKYLTAEELEHEDRVRRAKELGVRLDLLDKAEKYEREVQPELDADMGSYDFDLDDPSTY